MVAAGQRGAPVNSPSASAAPRWRSACAPSPPWCCRDRAAHHTSQQRALGGRHGAPPFRHRARDLPAAHFLVLGLAIHGDAKLDGFLRWSDQPLVKLAEGGLVFLLTVHLLGGLRVLVIENFDWRDGHKQLATAAAAAFGDRGFCLSGARVLRPSHDRATQDRHLDPGFRRRRPVRRAACLQGQSRSRHHGRDQGAARQMRLHPHGPGRLQRLAPSRRLGRAPFHGHDRGRQMAAASGARLDAGDDGDRARARTGKRDRLFLRPQSRRLAAWQGFCRADFRPHGAQRRPDRHRDHQPADGAGLGAADPQARRASRGGADPGKRRRAFRRPDDRYPHRRLPLRRRARPC